MNAYIRLTRQERFDIFDLYDKGYSLRKIATAIGRAPSTISREIRHNSIEQLKYVPVRADILAKQKALRPKTFKLDLYENLRVYVLEKLLKYRWSPKQIAQHLKKKYGDKLFYVNPKSIYKYIFVQTKSELKKELVESLRRKGKKPRVSGNPRFDGMVLIADRPPWLEDRRIPGHWEGDLIMGTKNQTQIGTLVERTTRYVKLVLLPEGKTAGYVAKRINEVISDIPKEMLKALTWDQGSELAEFKTIELANNIKVYFCDPASPWQRGTNENTNGLLRDWFPKGTDLSIYTQQDLDEVAFLLNNRPRQTLNWNTPAEAYQIYLRNQPLQ